MMPLAAVEVWVLPAIMLVIWLIQTVMKAREEPEKEKAVRPGAAPGTELDRFLAEIDRLKRQQTPKPSPPPIPPPVRQPERPAVIASPPPKPRQVAQTAPAPPAARPSEPSPASQSSPVIAPLTGSTSTVRHAGLPERRLDLPAVAALVRDTDSVRVAIILQEIISPPKCKRR